ncbi:hypothetical protein E2320_003000, partial [Naja naja]
VLPISLCNDQCHPGLHKKKKEGEPFCCYICVPCPERKISNQKDMNFCTECQEDEYSNFQQNQCIPKLLNYLAPSIVCSLSDPVIILHEFYQPGNLAIGEIVSQVFFLHLSIDFRDRPSEISMKEAIWTWIGLFAVNDDNGERFFQAIVPMLFENHICFAFIKRTHKWADLAELLDLFLDDLEKFPSLMKNMNFCTECQEDEYSNFQQNQCIPKLLNYLAPSIVCSLSDPVIILHEFYQPGNLAIGEIVSQVFFLHLSIDFRDRPSEISMKEAMRHQFLCVMTTAILVTPGKKRKGSHSAVTFVFHVQKEKFPFTKIWISAMTAQKINIQLQTKLNVFRRL